MRQPRDRRRKLTPEQLNKIRKDKAEKQKAKENFKWHWSLTIFLIGLVLGIISLAWLSSSVIIPTLEMLGIVAIIGLVSGAIQFNYFKNKKMIADTMNKALPFYIAYNIVGIGFIGLFIFFIINKSFASDKIIQEHYEVLGSDPDYLIYRYGNVVFLLEDDIFQNDVDLRALPYKNYRLSKTKPIMEYDFKKGLFGYKVKVDHRLIVKKPI